MTPVRTLLDTLADRQMRLHSLVVRQHGETLLDLWQWPNEPHRKHMMMSVTKSFTATAVAFAEADGLLRLDDPVTDFFPGGFAEPLGENLRRMRVRDLLTMRTGHARGHLAATTRLLRTGWTQEFLDDPVELPPGRDFMYSSTTSHALSAIVQHVTGQPVDEYLRPRLFEPLGITDYEWERDPAGVSAGGNGLALRSHDLIRFGELYLADGIWEGRRVLPAGWVQLATALHVRRAVTGTWNGRELVPPAPDAVADSGYGYQFWVTDDGAYDASGILGQECLVLPEHEAVIVTTGAMGGETYHDLPEMLRTAFRAAFREASPAGPDWSDVAELVRAAREPEPLSAAPGRSGPARRYRFDGDAPRAVTVEARADSVVVTVEDELGTHRIEHGLGRWIEQRTGVSVGPLHHSYQSAAAPVMAGAQWLGEDELELVRHYLETPFIDRITLAFRGDTVTLTHRVNVNSGAVELPAVTGTAEPR